MREKEKLFQNLAASGEDRMFLAHVLDRQRVCREQNYMTHTKFMDLRQRSLAAACLEQSGDRGYVFFGGHPQAERCVLIFYPDYWTQEEAVSEQNCPICLIRAGKSPADSLSHRDYLGSLMGLGIERECVGDILVTEEGAELFVMTEMADFLLLHYEKAGRKRLRLSREPLASVRPARQDSKLLHASVASPRLDGVLAAAFGISRSEAAEQIRKGLVFCNFRQCGKGDREVSAGDILNIRGKGKAEILEIGGRSRKGRVFLKIQRFI